MCEESGITKCNLGGYIKEEQSTYDQVVFHGVDYLSLL